MEEELLSDLAMNVSTPAKNEKNKWNGMRITEERKKRDNSNALKKYKLVILICRSWIDLLLNFAFKINVYLEPAKTIFNYDFGRKRDYKIIHLASVTTISL